MVREIVSQPTVPYGFDVSNCPGLRIVDGKQNPLTAYMTGKLKVHGDVSAALKLKHLFA